MRRKIAVLGILCLVSLCAQAHTRLLGSAPADAAVVAAPAEIVLTFSEAVTLTAVSIAQDDAPGGASKRDLEIASKRTSEEFVLEAPGLEPGEYVVSWRAIGADTHVITGEIRFTVSA